MQGELPDVSTPVGAGGQHWVCRGASVCVGKRRRAQRDGHVGGVAETKIACRVLVRKRHSLF